MQFIVDCIGSIRAACSGIKIEVRMDRAFFSDQIVRELDEQGVEFTISVPFERFSELKKMIDSSRRWRYFNSELSYFDTNWKPKKWDEKFRFLFIRKRVKQQSKELVQLDLFAPQQYGFEFKAIVTNKQTTMKKVLYFHNGRGSQENTIGELKSQCNMDYVAVRRLHGNHLYLMSAVLTHNILKELHMLVHSRQRGTTEKRAALWEFTEPNTLRRSLLQRAYYAPRWHTHTHVECQSCSKKWNPSLILNDSNKLLEPISYATLRLTQGTYLFMICLRDMKRFKGIAIKPFGGIPLSRILVLIVRRQACSV